MGDPPDAADGNRRARKVVAVEDGKPWLLEERLRAHWKDYMSHQAWEHLRVPQEELQSVAGERNIWTTLSYLL